MFDLVTLWKNIMDTYMGLLAACCNVWPGDIVEEYNGHLYGTIGSML